MPEIDPNSILASAGAALVKDFLKSLSSSMSHAISKKYYRYFESFSPYLERTYASCSTVKTIINKDRPVNIEEIYAKANFKCGKDIVIDDDLCQSARDNSRIIVTGFGGIGKTIFCKYLFVSIFKNCGGKIPVFFEPRKINVVSDKNLISYLRISLSVEGEILSEEIFRSMMLDGRFVFILDGFDEIPDEFRNDIQRQILDMAQMYRECGFVISSRFDDRFASWQEFYVYKALPFEKEQTLEVLNKSKFDKDAKKEFINNIFNNRYTDYKDFFCTPLLTLMMLMTYLQIRHIPDNVHVFYRYAFQTLFILHDASKEGFQRKRKLALSEQEFTEIFSIFCLLTYVDMEHTFDEEKSIYYIDKAKHRVNGDFSSLNFLNDATDSVNMLFKDGDQYTFIHRSFQEYFTAYALTHYFIKPIREVIKKIPRRESDSVFSMARAMNNAIIDELYLIPEYDILSSRLTRILRESDPIEILKLFEYNMSFGFQSDGRKLSPYMFRSYSDTSMDAFINTAYLMFKDDAPKELTGHFSSSPAMRSMRSISRHVADRQSFSAKGQLIDARVDLDGMAIRVSYQSFDDSTTQSVPFSISLGDMDWKKNVPIIIDVSHRIKSRAVFVKKKLDEIKRRYKKARNISDDILSM